MDKDPWTPDLSREPPDAPGRAGTPGDAGSGGTTTSSSASKDNVLKMANILDQMDDSETKMPDMVKLHEWAQRYIAVMGAPPQDEEEATDAQLAALHHFAIWLPFGRRVQKNQKFRAFFPLGDGSFVVKELPGSQNLQQWLVCWRVYKTACISLEIATLASVQLYEKVIDKLVLQWPKAWGLIAQADDKARAEKL